jgi:hypothetical protein
MQSLMLAVMLSTMSPAPPLAVHSSDTEAVSGTTAMSREARLAAVRADSDSLARKDVDYVAIRAASHPNEYFRVRGASSAADGHWEHAAKMFRMAAGYADKYSQHRLSLLYWHGVGVREDRVEAYLWADLAAERGYPQFLALREKMWLALSSTNQAAVAERGPALYARYGDPTAKPRLDREIDRVRLSITGSRTGFIGAVGAMPGEVLREKKVISVFEMQAVNSIFARGRLDPKQYWEQEDTLWKTPNVTVGDIEDPVPVPAAASSP